MVVFLAFFYLVFAEFYQTRDVILLGKFFTELFVTVSIAQTNFGGLEFGQDRQGEINVE
jgi:hypothetical protein